MSLTRCIWLFFQVSPSREMLCSRPDLLGLSLCRAARQPTLAWTPMRNVCPLLSIKSGHPLLHDLDTVSVCALNKQSLGQRSLYGG